MKIVKFRNDLKCGKYDKTWKGQIAKLDICAEEDGFFLCYSMMVEISPLGDSGPIVLHRHPICVIRIKFKWWHRIFGITEKQRIATGMKRLEKRWKYVEVNTKKFNDIKESYGILDE